MCLRMSAKKPAYLKKPKQLQVDDDVGQHKQLSGPLIGAVFVDEIPVSIVDHGGKDHEGHKKPVRPTRRKIRLATNKRECGISAGRYSKSAAPTAGRERGTAGSKRPIIITLCHRIQKKRPRAARKNSYGRPERLQEERNSFSNTGAWRAAAEKKRLFVTTSLHLSVRAIPSGLRGGPSADHCSI